MFLAFAAGIKGQEVRENKRTISGVAIKSNLLYDATASMNLGVELRTGARTSFDLSGSWNPFSFGENRKWKHALVQPEFRLWTRETFSGHFFGLHGHYAYYNISNLPHPPFSEYMAAHRFEGWLAGAGVSYGYRWNFARNWGIEATIGVGYAYLDYEKFECGECGSLLGAETKNYFGPTKAGISLVYGIGGRKKPAAHEPVYVQPVIPESELVKQEPEPVEETIIREPQFIVSFVMPKAEVAVQRSATEHIYLDYAVGQSVIVPSFRDNAARLQKIHGAVEAAQKDPNVTIDGVTITGYASPEGTYNLNLVLSQRRAEALKNQIKPLLNFPDNLFTVNGHGEDWATLDTLVSRSNMKDKNALLEIIRGVNMPEEGERKLMRLSGGNPYRDMKANLFPQLRRAKCELRLTIQPFSVEKGKEVFRTNPGSLSLNELYLIANTYAPGSDEFNEVFETAAVIYPQDDTSNLNAAASALKRKDAASAARYLEKVTNRNAAYWNNAGILAYMEGDTAKATECFNRAGAEAAANAEQISK